MTKSTVITKEFDAIKTALEVLEPLDAKQRQFVVGMILSRLDMAAPVANEVAGESSAGSGAEHAGAASTKAPGVRDFLKRKSPATDLERFACLAFYLTQHMGSAAFTTRDITKLNGEAGGQDFSNPAATAMNATRQSKLLSKAGGGKKRITIHGEDLVNALPDRVKVKEVMKSKTVRKRTARKPSKK
ncbi:MAG: hypothetical protein AAB074_21125 [Planctomycetota bacterium]